MSSGNPTTEAEQAFVEALFRGVVALERRAEAAVERARETLEAAEAQESSATEPFYEGAESAYVEAAACLAQLRVTLEGQIGRAALTQALSAALSWMDAERADALAALEEGVPLDEAHHARGRAEAFSDLITELAILRDAATRSMVVGSA